MKVVYVYAFVFSIHCYAVHTAHINVEFYNTFTQYTTHAHRKPQMCCVGQIKVYGKAFFFCLHTNILAGYIIWGVDDNSAGISNLNTHPKYSRYLFICFCLNTC